MTSLVLLLMACHGGGDDTVAGDDTDSADTDVLPSTPPWDWCPDASAYVGDDGWAGVLHTTGAALYCSASNEGRTLEQELAVKAEFRVVEGDWRVPADEGTYDLALPVCTQFPGDVAPAAMTGTGSTDVSPQTFAGTTYTYLKGGQPMGDGASTWTLEHTIVLTGDEGAAPNPLAVDGRDIDRSTGAASSFVLVPAGGSDLDLDAIAFGPCDDPAWDDNVHTVAFDGGDVEIHLHLGQNTILTGPGAVKEAKGTLDGVPFDVTDFYRLVYRPEHHHFGRHFAIVFDEPIGDVCALRVEDVDAQEGTTTAVVSTARCDLSVIEQRATVSESFVVE